MFYCELDAEQHTLEYVSGGHNPSLWSHQRQVAELESTGPIVGLVQEAEFTSNKIVLTNGDTVLLYTDGITEILDEDGNEFGTDRLAKILAEDPGRDSGSLILAIRQQIEAFSSGARLDDDTTLVVVRRLP